MRRARLAAAAILALVLAPAGGVAQSETPPTPPGPPAPLPPPKIIPNPTTADEETPEKFGDPLDEGMRFLVRVQSPDGSWSGGDPEGETARILATAHALSAFAATGHTHRAGRLTEVRNAVERGLTWILAQQVKTGDRAGAFVTKSDNAALRAHVAACHALAQALFLSRDRERLQGSVENGARWLLGRSTGRDVDGHPIETVALLRRYLVGSVLRILIETEVCDLDGAAFLSWRDRLRRSIALRQHPDGHFEAQPPLDSEVRPATVEGIGLTAAVVGAWSLGRGGATASDTQRAVAALGRETELERRLVEREAIGVWGYGVLLFVRSDRESHRRYFERLTAAQEHTGRDRGSWSPVMVGAVPGSDRVVRTAWLIRTLSLGL